VVVELGTSSSSSNIENAVTLAILLLNRPYSFGVMQNGGKVSLTGADETYLNLVAPP
jgi:hypothetical protein